MMKAITKVSLNPIKVLTPNGFSHGLVTKRPVTTREAKYIMRNIFGIDVNDRECFESKEDYDEYNNELTQNFNDWLNGDADDQTIMDYAYDCSDEPIGLFNAFKMAEYLQKKVKELYSDKGDDSKPNLKPFDLEAAKDGKPVCTRDGRKARIICFDRKDIKPIVALVTSINGDNINEKAFYYFEDGQHLSKYDNNINDLMMLPEKKEGWVNVYKGIDGVTFSTHPYTSKDEAIKKSGILSSRIDTIKVSWEE